jgi:hypothetical protein
MPDGVPHEPQAWLMVTTRRQAYAAPGREDALALRWRDRAVAAARLRVARAVISMARWRPAIPLPLVNCPDQTVPPDEPHPIPLPALQPDVE